MAEYRSCRRRRECVSKAFFAGETHFRADAGPRGHLGGEPAPVDSTSPRYCEEATDYSAVCQETREAKWMGVGGELKQRNASILPCAVPWKAQRPAECDKGQRPAHLGEEVQQNWGLCCRLSPLVDNTVIERTKFAVQLETPDHRT